MTGNTNTPVYIYAHMLDKNVYINIYIYIYISYMNKLTNTYNTNKQMCTHIPADIHINISILCII